MVREIAREDVLCEALLVSAYHTININFFFSVATPSASHVLTRVYRYSEPQAYVRISVAVHSAIHLMSQRRFHQWCSTFHVIPCLMVILSCSAPRVVAFQVSWYYTWRGISRTQISWYYTWRCPSRNPVACKSMVTRRIFKSHTLTFACDTCKLTRVCEVIVELYRTWFLYLPIHLATCSYQPPQVYTSFRCISFTIP